MNQVDDYLNEKSLASSWDVVNNSPLRWTMHEGSMNGICLWSWIKVIYESADKLDPLKILYAENIMSLKLKASELIIEYIEQFQGLKIL